MDWAILVGVGEHCHLVSSHVRDQIVSFKIFKKTCFFSPQWASLKLGQYKNQSQPLLLFYFSLVFFYALIFALHR